MKAQVERDNYVEAVGFEPRMIDDPEGQWLYRGTQADKDRLAQAVKHHRVHALDCDMDDDCTCFGVQETLF